MAVNIQYYQQMKNLISDLNSENGLSRYKNDSPMTKMLNFPERIGFAWISVRRLFT
jgi:hypothetical protein